jgi:hypothetical protein
VLQTKLEARVAQLERDLKQVRATAEGALQIPPMMRGGTPGVMLANGRPMLGLTGLISILSQPAGPIGWSGDFHPGNTFTVMTGSSVTFKVNQNVTLLFLLSQEGKCTTTGGGTFAITAIFLDGVERGVSENIWDVGVTGYTNGFAIDTASVAIGSHTVDVRVKTDNVNTHFGTLGSDLFIFQFGQVGS